MTKLDIEQHIRDIYKITIDIKEHLFKPCFFHKWQKETIGPYNIRRCLKCAAIEYQSIDYIGGSEEWHPSNRYFFQLVEHCLRKAEERKMCHREKFIDYIVHQIEVPDVELLENPVKYRLWIGEQLMKITSTCSNEWIEKVFGETYVGRTS